MKKGLPIILMLCMLFSLISRTPVLAAKNEGQRFREAEKLFHAKQFEKALPVFAQLVSSHPKNYKYNYYYGVCLLIAGKEKSLALNYLDKALDNQKTPEEVYYYFGRALHLAYRFDEAREYITEFNTLAGREGVKEWGTSQLLDMINQAERLLDFSKNSQITAKTEAPAQEFFDKYKFEQPQGKLLSMPDDMIASTKNQGEERPTIFLSGNGRVIYYSAFARETGSRDIYRVEKDHRGQWGVPVRLDKSINSSQDEAYPTCNHDGRILYFSSKGHYSTGGFDIFKTTFNSMEKKWKKPVNMGSPVNSPDDDYHFLCSAVEKKAYFSSQRESAPGTLTVYQIPYTLRENLPIAVQGKIGTQEGTTTNGGLTVEVTDEATKNQVAQLTCSTTDGSFPLEVAYPGLYTLSIQSPGGEPMTARIEITEAMDGTVLDEIAYSPGSRVELTPPFETSPALTAMEDEEQEGTGSSGLSDRTASNVSHVPAADHAFEIGDIEDHTTVFKVQIGAFRVLSREVVKQRLEKMTDVNMLSSHKDNTWLRFYFGEEDSYQSAHNLRNTLKLAGFKDAFVAAFRNGQPVNIREALGQHVALAEDLDN